MSAIAVVVARAGSSRVPRKALRTFAGTTLVGWAVERLLDSEAFREVYVGSDGDEILAEAERHGAIAIKRDDHHCDETRCSANEMIGDMMDRLSDVSLSETVCWAHPTNPLVLPSTYARAVEVFERDETDADSLVSVGPVQRHAWFRGRPLNHDPRSPRHQLASELEPLQFQNGAIFIQTRRAMAQNCYFYGSTPLLFEIDSTEGFDVDTEADLRMAAFLLAEREAACHSR